MTSSPKVPSSPRYLRLFGVSLAVVVLCLLVLLFGVSMEATVAATGIIKAREQRECRAPLFGLIDPGWHEGQVALPGGAMVPFRVDSAGNGCTIPTTGASEPIWQLALPSGQKLNDLPTQHHPLTAGDIVLAGQPLARINPEPWRFLPEGLPAAILLKQDRQLESVQKHIDREASMLAPASQPRWLVLKVMIEPGAAVQAGDPVVWLAPVVPGTNRIQNLVAEVWLDEQRCDEVRPGLAVRLQSNVFHHRFHGSAEGKLERLDPWGEPGPHGERRYRGLVQITQSPFQFPLGSSVKAEVILGRKMVYRIIMEH